MEVQIISKKLIKPSLPTLSHLRNMSVSLMDIRFPPRTIPFIFYYTLHGNYHSAENVGILKARLEKSLSEILTLYYPLAGRYVKEKLLIYCNDEGVEYAEALVDGQLSQILQGQFEIKELNRFVPNPQHQLEELATSPLVAVQINIFNCGGLAIGLSFSHRIMDGFTCLLFTDGWAKTCKVGNITDVNIPNFESGILFPPRDHTIMSKLPSLSTSQVVTRRFVFDAKTISKLKADVMTPSTTEVLIALIWRAQINAARIRYGFLRTSLLSVTLNLRGKTFKKVPENCCGNIITVGTARFEEVEKTKMIITRLNNGFVDKVRDAIRNTIAEFGKPNEDEDEDGFFSKLIKRSCIEVAEQVEKGVGDVHRFSSLRNFPIYEVDFGWGKPAWVSFTQRPYKGVILIDRKCGDGMEAWVTMDEEEMIYFQNDPNITMPDAIPIPASKI